MVNGSSAWAKVRSWANGFREGEGRVTLYLSLVIGALVGLVVVAFILLTGRLAARMYPAGGSPWRRILVPTGGALLTGYLLARYFPDARGSGIPQTKYAALRWAVKGPPYRLEPASHRCSAASSV